MVEFITSICGVTLPEPFVAMFCILFVLVFISLLFGVVKAVFGR